MVVVFLYSLSIYFVIKMFSDNYVIYKYSYALQKTVYHGNSESGVIVFTYCLEYRTEKQIQLALIR